ncbi:MAG TPA: hypothetical protein VGL47_38945 [Amycolatopsis sp.]|uniref:Uncharacterized protein n=1 Tax=Amycolatopsis nalaikhensis TaxID=715472 RepID=A0ABY8XCQ3_9PSEU|nr:hypothetical protein [Amycolatopsis sp. 2-2]WIV53269.1 hypothetical protein QP939_30685 [Amycolatopsis sp. 2-2]
MTVAADRQVKDPCAWLSAVTHELADVHPAETRAVLLTVWDGLVAARLAGLHAAAASPRWRARQRHAEAVEFDLALVLARRCTVGTGLAIPARLRGAAVAWPVSRADAAVAAIIAFCGAAEGTLRRAGELTPVWEDSLLGPVALTRWLADSWTGKHTGCPLSLPVPPPTWWR